MSNLAFAFVNLADDATITASSAVTLAPASRLQNQHVANVWRGLNGNTESLTIDLLASVAWDTIALLGTNLTTDGATRVRASDTDTSGQLGEIYDSGSAVGRIDERFRSLVLLRSSSVASRYVRIDLSEPGSTFIEAGRLFIGMRQQVAINYAWGWGQTWNDRTRKTEGVSGQTFMDVQDGYRSIDLTLDFLSDAERTGFVETMDADLGAHGDFLTITDPASSRLDRDSVWGYQEQSTPVVSPAFFDRFSKSYRIRERL